MKIATFNANSIRMRLPIVLDWLKKEQPDVLCVQETKAQDVDFPIQAFEQSGYHVSYRGMKSYNGVAVFSRRLPEKISFGFTDGGDPEEARLAHVVIDGISIINTYVPQGYLIDSPKYAHKLGWYKRLRAYFEKHLDPTQPVLWCGDMNVAPRDIDVHHPEKYLKHVCFHVDAKAAYAEAVSWGFIDVFTHLHPNRAQFTFWDYRFRPGQQSSLEANLGWRIDHILATAPLAARCEHVEVDIEPRRHATPSDHTFLWARFKTDSK